MMLLAPPMDTLSHDAMHSGRAPMCDAQCHDHVGLWRVTIRAACLLGCAEDFALAVGLTRARLNSLLAELRQRAMANQIK